LASKFGLDLEVKFLGFSLVLEMYLTLALYVKSLSASLTVFQGRSKSSKVTGSDQVHTIS